METKELKVWTLTVTRTFVKDSTGEEYYKDTKTWGVYSNKEKAEKAIETIVKYDKVADKLDFEVEEMTVE